MKASVYTSYGPPEVLRIMEVEKPAPKENQVLIKIQATTVNRTDCGFRKPEYLIVRFVSGIFRPKKKVLGSELAGVIEAVGNNVKTFKPGDQVFGLSTYNFGTHAEYICLKEEASIARKPVNMNFNEAAAVCDGLMLAINYLRKIDFKKSSKILVNGASGSIGSACVQLAKYYGAAEITAVCNTGNLELLKSLGADEVLDYTKVDFTKHERHYDYVIDAVGKSSFFKCRKLLNSGGVYFSTELGFLSQNVWLPIITSMSGKKVKFPIPTDSQKDILFFKELIEAGKYKAVIDRIYPLEEIVEANRYVETGQKTGNVVITLV